MLPPGFAPEDYRGLFDLAASGIAVVDTQGVVTFANPRLAQLLGRSVAELVGRPMLDHVAPASLADSQQAWGHRLAGLSETFPCEFAAGDGRVVTALVSSAPILGVQGQVSGVLEILTPLSELREDRVGGRTLGGACVAVLDGFQEGVWITDTRDEVFYANPALATILSLPGAASAVGRKGDGEFPADPTGGFRAAYQRARASRRPEAFTNVPLAAGQGRAVLVSGWIAPRGQEGAYEGMLCTATDVTVRSRDQTVTTTRLEHFERLLGQLPAPVVVWNAGRRISQVNRAFERLTGYAAAELLGRDLGTLFPPAHRAETLGRLGRLGADEPVQSLETVVVRRDGRERWFLWGVTPVAGREAGVPLATVAFVQDTTERRLLEQVSHDGENEHRRLLDEMRVGVWVVRSDGTTVLTNPFVTELLGNDWDQLARRPFHERVSPEDVVPMQQAWGRWLAGVSETVECRFLRREGGWRDCLVSAAPLSDESGQVTRVVLTLSDLSDRRLREEALQGSESLLRTVAEHLPLGFLLLQTDGNIRAFNQKATQLAGILWARGLEAGRSLYLVVAETELDLFNRSFQQALAGRPVSVDWGGIGSASPARTFRLVFSPVGNVGGHPSGILCTVQETTEDQTRQRRDAEERETRRRRHSVAWQHATSAAAVVDVFLAAVREHFPAACGGLCLTDPDSGHLVLTAAREVPASWQGLLGRLDRGRPGQELVADGRAIFLPLSGLGGGEPASGGTGMEPVLGLIPIRSGSGAEAWFLVGFARNPALDGAALGVLESLAAEAGGALCRLNAEEDLRQQQAAGQDFAALKSRLFSTLAHELRTPATGLIGAAEILEGHFEQLDADQRREMLHLLLLSARRVVTALDGLETLGGQGDELIRSCLSRVSLPEVVHGTLARARERDGGRHPLLGPAAGEAHETTTDAGAVGQVLALLVDNALRYSPPGSPVEVRLRREEGWDRIEVIDRGPGVPEADRERIFEPFERGENAGENVGAGLGLALARRLADRLGARLTLSTSGPGETCFCLALPCG